MSSTTNNALTFELAENLPIAIFKCNAGGYVTSFNAAAVKLWGHEPVLGTSQWGGSYKLLKPTGQPIEFDEHPVAKAIKTKTTVDGEEFIIRREDGRNVNVIIYSSPVFDDNGELSGAITTILDVTDQKIGEQKQAMLASIITTSEDAIVSKTLEGIVTSWNEGARHLFGYSEEEVVGNSITILIPENRLQEETEILSKIRNGEKVEHYKTLRKHKSGLEIPVSLAISPIKDSKGNIIGASKIARNVYKQQQAENQLQQYAQNLEILNAVGKAISENLDVETILQKVTDASTNLTGAAFGAFFYNKVDEQGESYMLYTLSGAPREVFENLGMPRNTAVFNHTFWRARHR